MSRFEEIEITQKVEADANNTTSTNLTAGDTWTGTSSSTLGVVGIQWSLKCNENCTVYIEESDDESNWDISYEFDYIASKGGRGETVQATKAYWRAKVKNEGTSTTSYLRFAGVLCPIAVPLPSALSEDGRLKSECHIAGQTDRHVWVNPTNEIATSPVYRIVGTAFDGSNKDPNFWTETTDNGGTVVKANAEIQLETNTTANGYAQYQSVRKARFVAGSAQLFSGAVNWETAGTANNIRRVGAYTTDATDDIEDGFFFQLSGTTFSVGYCNDSSVTTVDSGSFNGNLGDTWSPTADTYYKIDIEFTPMGGFWYINGKLLHKIAGTAGFVGTNTVNITIENENTSDSTTDVKFNSVGLYIARQGELHTNPTSYYAGTNATTVLKVGAGSLHRVTVTDNQGDMLIYDGLSAAGVLMASLDAAKTVGTMEFGCPFSDGLTIVTTGTPKMTVVYE